MLEDLLVIELASVLAGPSVGMFLAEQGARVIKVENLRSGGDLTRSWHLASESPQTDRPAYFCAANWGKESLALDLKKNIAKDILYPLIRKADVVVSSYIPGTAERLGVDASTLLQLNPQLICAEINGYGPAVSRAAFDAIIQAEAGFTYLNGEKGNGMCKMPVALMDILAGHQLKEGLLLALIKRLKTGEGSLVQISLIESALASLANQATNWLVAGHKPQPLGSEHPNIVPYGSIFYTADKLPVVPAIGNDRQFEALLALLELPADLRFTTNTERLKNKAALLELLQVRIGLWPRHELLAACEARQIPLGAVNEVHEAMQLEQAQPLILEEDGIKGLRTFVGEERRRLLPPPHLGEHSRQILERDLALDKKFIDGLMSKNVVG